VEKRKVDPNLLEKRKLEFLEKKKVIEEKKISNQKSYEQSTVSSDLKKRKIENEDIINKKKKLDNLSINTNIVQTTKMNNNNIISPKGPISMTNYNENSESGTEDDSSSE
jgi:hypothetical protein